MYFVLTQPEKTDLWRARILSLFSWAGVHVRRLQTQAYLQGTLNTFARGLDEESPGALPYNLKLEFVEEIERAELLRSPTVLVRIRDRGNEDINLVHALVTFCSVGFVPPARDYLEKPLADALDLTLTRKVLIMDDRLSSSTYLYKELMEPTKQSSAETAEFCEMLDRLDEQGLFSRVFIKELVSFGQRCLSRQPTDTLRGEPIGLLRYLNEVALRAVGSKMVDRGYVGEYIAAGIVFVGSHANLMTTGTLRYLNYLRRLWNEGIQTAYLAARSGYIEAAEAVANDAVRIQLGRRMHTRRYYALDKDGSRRRHLLIELKLSPPGQAPLELEEEPEELNDEGG